MTPPSPPRSRPILKIISYNLRYATASGGLPWSERRPLLVDFLREAAASVVGTQEGLIGALQELADDLPAHYAWVGEGRRGGTDDEHSAVFYDTRRLEAVHVENRWLSDTAEVVGSTTWGNELPRIFTAVTFADRRSGAQFEMINTHFDHVSDTARERSAEQLRAWVRNAEAAGRPSVVTGDFNADAGHCRAYDTLMATPLNDTYVVAGKNQGIGTFNNYAPPGPGPQIDWILTSPDIAVESARIIDNAVDGRYPSDHLPVEAEIRINASVTTR